MVFKAVPWGPARGVANREVGRKRGSKRLKKEGHWLTMSTEKMSKGRVIV